MPFFPDTSLPGFVLALKSSLTNNIPALYIMDQSWCVWEGGIYLQSDAITRTYCIRCVRLKSSSAQTDQYLKSKYPRERFERIMNRLYGTWCHTPNGLHTQTKPKPRYFRQYRNPGHDASRKNGTYGHPSLMHFPQKLFPVCMHQSSNSHWDEREY